MLHELQSGSCAATIVGVEKPSPRAIVVPDRSPFVPGSIVVLTLASPREKIWGMILALAPEGLSLSGIDLSSFDDFVVTIKEGEPFTPAVVFFPMHRVERVDLDSPDSNLPSLSQRFATKTGGDPSIILTPAYLRPEATNHDTEQA